MKPILSDLSPPVLAEAIESAHVEYLAWRGRSPRADLHESPELMRVFTGVADASFNAIFRVRLPADGLDERIETAMAPVRERRLPLFWWIGPATQPAGLASRLAAHGLKHRESMPGMAVDLHALNETLPRPLGLTIEPVRDGAGLLTWCVAVARASGAAAALAAQSLDLFRGLGLDLPGRYYVGHLNGDPVATSFLLLGGGVAGIYSVCTVPEARRRGIGAAMTLEPLREARAMGYRIGVLAASPMGESLYCRLGFQEYCRLDLYLWTP